VEFRRKLHFLSAELHLDPFPLLALHPELRSAPLPLLHDSLRLLLSHGLSAGDASRVFAAFPTLLTSPPEESLRFLSAAALDARTVAATVALRRVRSLPSSTRLRGLPGRW
jgi:mTERF domain-containing protein